MCVCVEQRQRLSHRSVLTDSSVVTAFRGTSLEQECPGVNISVSFVPTCNINTGKLLGCNSTSKCMHTMQHICNKRVGWGRKKKKEKRMNLKVNSQSLSCAANHYQATAEEIHLFSEALRKYVPPLF